MVASSRALQLPPNSLPHKDEKEEMGRKVLTTESTEDAEDFVRDSHLNHV